MFSTQNTDDKAFDLFFVHLFIKHFVMVIGNFLLQKRRYLIAALHLAIILYL